MNATQLFEYLKPFAERVLSEPEIYGHVVVVAPADRPRLLNDSKFTLDILEKRLAARIDSGADPLAMARQYQLPIEVQNAECAIYATDTQRAALARVMDAAIAQRRQTMWWHNPEYTRATCE